MNRAELLSVFHRQHRTPPAQFFVSSMTPFIYSTENPLDSNMQNQLHQEQHFFCIAVKESIVSNPPDSLKTLALQDYAVIINLMPDASEYAVADERETVASQKLEYI